MFPLTQRFATTGAIATASAVGTPHPVRFAANQSVTVSTGAHYARAEGGSPATLTIALSGRDDHGHAITASLAVRVAAFSG